MRSPTTKTSVEPHDVRFLTRATKFTELHIKEEINSKQFPILKTKIHIVKKTTPAWTWYQTNFIYNHAVIK